MKSTFVARVLSGLALALTAATVMAPGAAAHPLGNFTINHYSGLRVGADGVVIDQVTDYAEIPTFSERRTMDTDGDGAVSGAEASRFEGERCAAMTSELALTSGGRQVGLTLTHSGLSFPMGQGSLTMRLVCVYHAPFEAPLAAGTSLAFEDRSYAERSGWREIVVEANGATLTESDAPASGVSDRLTDYPADLLAIPLGQSMVHFTARPGGPALAPLSLPDALPVGAPDAAEPDAAAPAAADDGAGAPAGVTELSSDLTALFQASELTPPIIVLSLLAAAALGALHALSPGHGKTVMAAYLVGSRGTVRHAVGLGLTVTVSHTLGVLALGALSLSAASVIPPERLYPVLSVVSGVTVIAIGGYLLLSRLRAHHGHGHQAARPDGSHEHDGIGHTHLPSNAMGRRGLFALGLSGGMIPSVSALLVLLGSISLGRPLFGILLTVAFGLGMAAVLVGVGLALVYARRFVERMPAAAPLRLAQRLPLVTAVVVLLAGVLITGQGLINLG